MDEALEAFDEVNSTTRVPSSVRVCRPTSLGPDLFSYPCCVTCQVYAISEGIVRPFQSRGDALDTLASMEAAYLGPAKMAELALEPAEVTHARLLAFLSRSPPDVQAFVLQPRGRDSDASGTSLVDLAETTRASCVARRDLIDFLPPEMLIAIGRLVVKDAESSDVAFALAAVSRRWRAIFLDDAQMWGSLVLDGKTQTRVIAKVEAFLAKGSIRHLVVNYPLSQPRNRLVAVLDGRLPGLRSLVIRSPTVPFRRVLELVEWSWELETLVVYIPNDPKEAELSVSTTSRRPIPSITRLELRRRTAFQHTIIHGHCLDWFNDIFPRLHSLVITHPSYMLCPIEPGRIVAHLHLRTLELRGREVWNELPAQTSFVFPNLQTLDLSDSPAESYIPYLFPPSAPPNTQHFTHLLLCGSDVDEPTLISNLADMPSLVHLDVRQTDAFRALVKGLVHPAEGDAGPRLCPRLEQLQLDSSGPSPNSTTSDDGEDLDASYPDIDCLCASRRTTTLKVSLWVGRIKFMWS